MRLNLSQDLVINNKYTISVPGETEHYFGGCSLEGETEHIDNAWFALTEKAQEVWKGETRVDERGTILGGLYSKSIPE